MPPTQAARPWDQTSFFDGFEVLATRVGGLPGMAVLLPDLPFCGPRPAALAVVRGFLLAEKADGSALGARIQNLPGPLPPFDAVLLNLTDGNANALTWLDTRLPLEEVSELDRFGLLGGDRDLRGRLVEGLRARIREALPQAGFSPTFLDALDCASLWRQMAGVAGTPLFRPDACGARIRSFSRSHPFLCSMAFPTVRELAEEGPVEPTALLPGLTPALVSRLAAPAWSPRLLDVPGSPFEEIRLDRAPLPLLAFLTSVPIDWIPTEAAGIQSIVKAFFYVRGGLPTGRSVAELAASSKGDWAAFLARCVGATRLGDCPNLFGSHLADPARSLAKWVVLPMLLRAGRTEGLDARIDDRHPAYPIAARLLYGGRSLPACLEVSQRWHDNLQAMLAAFPVGSGADVAWPSFAPDWTVHVGEGRDKVRCLVTVLTTGIDLFEEGSPRPDRNGVPGLDHCVASYRDAAYRGDCHIVSIRRVLPGGGYERLATAEIRQPTRRSRSEAVQVHGLRNGPPGAIASGALNAWLTKRGIRPYMPPRDAKGGDGAAYPCGYDHTETALVEQAIHVWGFLLPRSLRTLDALQDRLGLVPEAKAAEAA